MANISMKGTPIHTVGNLPAVGSKLPNFTLTKQDLSNVSAADYTGKRIVFNIFPSVDTGVCALSVRKFNEVASSLPNTVVLNVSMDLPFAHKRFCAAENIKNCESLSAFRSSFGKDFGATIQDSGMNGLLSRAVVVADADHKVIYTEQVNELSNEPNYSAAIAALKEKTNAGCCCC